MKRVLLGLALFGSIASADFIGASVGAGMWQENIDGYVKTGDDINYMNKKSAETDGNEHTGNLGLSDEVKPYVWAKIIHPVPLIPNIKAEYRQYDTAGDGIAVGTLKVFGQNISLNGKVHTEITINSYDVTAFYELKLFAEVEAGVGVNVLDGTTKVKQLDSTNPISTETSWIALIPYLYARVETPTILGFSAEAQGKYLDVGSAYYHDYQGALKYHIVNTILDVSLALGYKYQDIYGEDGDNVTNLKFEGAYAELGVRW
jgi:outer membrane protein